MAKFHDIESDLIGDGALSISAEAAQVLFDDLWKAGLRPTDSGTTSGQIAAIKYHLEDMRRLVFGKSGKDVKEKP